jgi:hypothetical protein
MSENKDSKSRNLLSFIESDDSNKEGLNKKLEEYQSQTFHEPLLESKEQEDIH